MKKSIFLIAVVITLVACATNPFSVAKTDEQKAFATYGTFVVMEELGAAVIGDPNVGVTVKRAIQRADAKAKPIADQGKKLAFEYIAIKNDLNAAADKKLAAATNLSRWYTEAKPLVDCMVKVVSGGDASCSN